MTVLSYLKAKSSFIFWQWPRTYIKCKESRNKSVISAQHECGESRESAAKYEPRAVRNVARNERNPSSESESVHTCRFSCFRREMSLRADFGPQNVSLQFFSPFSFLVDRMRGVKISELDKYLRVRFFSLHGELVLGNLPAC